MNEEDRQYKDEVDTARDFLMSAKESLESIELLCQHQDRKYKFTRLEKTVQACVEELTEEYQRLEAKEATK